MSPEDVRKAFEADGYLVGVGEEEIFIDLPGKPDAHGIVVNKPLFCLVRRGDSWSLMPVKFSSLDRAAQALFRLLEGPL